MMRDLSDQLDIQPERLAVLSNPLDIESIRAIARGNPLHRTETTGTPGPHLLAVGRLSHEKGFDLLLHALIIVRRQFPNADLTIAGSGDEEARLKAQCIDLGLQSAVQFTGHVNHPAAYFQAATLFVLSSRHEGMPNALLEAAAGGLPLVALPACGGVSDLLRDQPGAWLAAEVSAEALGRTLLDALQVLQPDERFAHPFIEEFRLARVLRAYENLIDSVLADRRRSRIRLRPQ
jgi:glycosyltransferase involved in cell wall biosynthesis